MMDILFKREQSNAASGGANFKLWGKIELDDDEKAIVKKYKFSDAILIFVDQPGLVRKSFVTGLVGFSAGFALLSTLELLGITIALVIGIVTGYFYYHQKRETLYVKDLLHGRYFVCDSVVDLARKEAWLGTIVSFLRQVMESAKHWDGTERHTVEPLPKEEARQVIIRGI